MTHVVIALTDLEPGLAALRSAGPEVVVLVAGPTDAGVVAPLLELLQSRPDLAGVVSAGPVADTLKRVDSSARVIGTSDRDGQRLLGWPQAYRVAALPAGVAAGDDDAPDRLVRAVLGGGGKVYALETD